MRLIDWEAIRPLLKRLVLIEKLTDEDLGERFGVTESIACYHRRKLGIKAPKRGTLDRPAAPKRPLHSSIVEENGVKVTICQPGYAHGFGLNRYTVKPKASK